MKNDMGIYVYLYIKEPKFKDGRYVARHRQFLPSDYTEEEWRRLWNETLHKEFDPFKENFEEYIRNQFGKDKIPFCINITSYKELLKRNLILKKIIHHRNSYKG